MVSSNHIKVVDNMRTREIRDEIIELISDKVGIDKDRLYHYGKDKSLLDASIGLQPRDMLTLFFDLQRKYRISFAESDIIEKRFDFLDNIVDAIIDKQVSY
jgi:acyl carrier protein